MRPLSKKRYSRGQNGIPDDGVKISLQFGGTTQNTSAYASCQQAQAQSLLPLGLFRACQLLLQHIMMLAISVLALEQRPLRACIDV